MERGEGERRGREGGEEGGRKGGRGKREGVCVCVYVSMSGVGMCAFLSN